MKTLCIVPCGNRKIWNKNPNAGPTKARHVYIGPFASKCMEYAEKFYPDTWRILSAKYGFLSPEDTVHGDYNITFNKQETNPITIEELAAQVREMRLSEYGRIVALGGKKYITKVSLVFKEREVLAPLNHCKGIGYMMATLNDAIKRGIPLS